MRKVPCPYCRGRAEMVNGYEIYPHRADLAHKLFWACKPCGAWVGCHPGTGEPLGRLADAALRKAKQSAHAAFDPLWQSKKMRRSAAYKWLAEQLGLTQDQTHIGLFDQAQCMRVIEVCKERREQA